MRVEMGPASSLEAGGRLSAVVDDRTVVVFDVDGELCAIDGKCGHRGGPLQDGVLRDGVVTCPWHLIRYDVRSGERTDAPAVKQDVYPVYVENGTIMVDIPEQKGPESMRDILLRHAEEWSRDP